MSLFNCDPQKEQVGKSKTTQPHMHCSAP